MIPVSHLVAALESRGIVLFLADGALRYRSRKDALTESDKTALAARRDAIIDFLRARGAAMGLRSATPESAPPMPAVNQEMWWRFAGGADEGKPIALNIGMMEVFAAGPGAVEKAIRAVVARHDTLRSRFRAEGETLRLAYNPGAGFAVEHEDLRDAPDARAEAERRALAFCGEVIPILGDWLTRARVFALPGGETMAVLCASHMIADAASRNIVVAELHDLLEHPQTAPMPLVPFNDYAAAERDFLAGSQGETLIDYWRRWYGAQQPMRSPERGRDMLWGPGDRANCNFDLPRADIERLRALASETAASPFLVCLAVYAIALSRWSGRASFPVRCLGDKRTAHTLSHTVGLMFCADTIDVHLPDGDFPAIVRALRTAYEAAVALRLPSLHFYAPHCVRPGIEPGDFPNAIPAAINYYALVTERERARLEAMPHADAPAWPPAVTQVTQYWSRRMSPVFLHMVDKGASAQGSLQFNADVLTESERARFVSLFFDTFAACVRAA